MWYKKNKECMLHKYPNCSESNTLLQDFLFNSIGDFDDNVVFEFSQWTTTDWSNLIHHAESVNVYTVIKQLHILTVHSYISKCQSRHYKFVLQDEFQGFHWNYSQCTLHPVVIYYQENDELKIISYRVIAGNRKHDVALVCEVQKAILSDLTFKLPRLSTVIYFTDGCAGQ